MNQTETAELLRNRRNLTGGTYTDDTITAWHAALADLDYQACFRALIEASRDEKRVSVAHIFERLPKHSTSMPPALQRCCRCNTEPAEIGRTRCARCQAIIDDETARGLISPARAEAMHAIRSKRPAPDESRYEPPSETGGHLW